MSVCLSFLRYSITPDTTADRQPINITCNTQYKPENATYDIIVNWDVDPLAAAAVQFYDVSLDLVQPRSPFFRLDSRRIKVLITCNAK